MRAGSDAELKAQCVSFIGEAGPDTVTIALCVCCRMREALTYLAHAYETNATLLRNGEKRGMDKSIIAVYRRKCLSVSKAALAVSLE